MSKGQHDGHFWVGIDIGGTFTDFLLLNTVNSDIQVHKYLTTADDPSRGAVLGFQELLSYSGVAVEQVSRLIHGTTLAANAIIERRGARVGLLTTRGCRDVLERGIEHRYDVHDLFLKFPEPLVAREMIREIDERIGRDGDILVSLDRNQVERAGADLIAAGVESIAVCFLHAYRNPIHEQAVGEIIRQLGVPCSLSADVVPELGEYERCTTTAANAYVQCIVDEYLTRFEQALRSMGFSGRLYLMQSSGGTASPAVAREFPIRLLESGPAGGALATAYFGRRLGQPDMISFDMGGTTAKTCLIQSHRPDAAPKMEIARVHRFKRGSGLPIRAPMIDMVEIGAGGGSIARVDSLGLLKVGPDSAGSDPGPACYGRGGTQPTVTDANLMLGYLDADYFLGGRMKLKVDAAQSALQLVADPLNLSPSEAAWGIFNIVNENMAAAARTHLVEKGRDPRRYALMAFGGAGPSHAARVARSLGISEVIVPPASGAVSALGFLVSPISFDFVTSLPGVLTELDWSAVNSLLLDLEAKGRRMLDEAGVPQDQITITRTADMRLLGQLRHITSPLPNSPLGPDAIPAIQADFQQEYRRRYTELYEAAVQVISWRVHCTGPIPDHEPGSLATSAAAAEGPKTHRSAYFPETGGFERVPVYDRYRLKPGSEISGPAIIEERESTTVVCPGDVLSVDAEGNLRIQINAGLVVPAALPPGLTLQQAIARIEADPIGLETMWSRLINISEECWLDIWRTAFSLIVGESQDFGCELLDPEGEALAHPPNNMGPINLILPVLAKALLKTFPIETLRPGDILCTNDPWVHTGHLHDIGLVTPVFRDDKVVALISTFAHVADIGGTNDSFNAHELYEEGLQIPHTKLYRAGELNQELVDIIALNVRKSEQAVGDIYAMVSASASTAKRLLAFMDEYGMEDLRALAAVIHRRSEHATREQIQSLPDGQYDSELWCDGVGEPLRLPVKVTVSGDEMLVDLNGAPPQVPRGGCNCTFCYASAYVLYATKCLLTPNAPSNAGCFKPIRVVAPEGSVYNCSRPVAVDNRTRTGWYLAPNVLHALAGLLPERVQAFSGLPVYILTYGHDERGRTFNDYLYQGGGQGASAHGDGKSCLLWPNSASATGIELYETRAPLLVMTKEYIADSGGAGKYRGGLGQLIRVRKLYDDQLPVHVVVHLVGVLTEGKGLFGGKSGSLCRAVISSPEGVVDCGLGGLFTLTDPSEVLEVMIAGGSGYGNPADRSNELVERDVALGYITVEGAQRDYGFMRVEERGVVPRSATVRRR